LRLAQALGSFLEKRQRKGGFLSGGVNKKSIVKSLQSSVLRQQAQVKTNMTAVLSFKKRPTARAPRGEVEFAAPPV
jgi:hypothetical protein